MRLLKPDLTDVRERRVNDRKTRKCPGVTPVCEPSKAALRFAGSFAKPSSGLEPLTPSLPWRFWGVTRVHARSLATHFLLQIGLLQAVEMRRETSRVSFLMCPFCVRALLTTSTTTPRT